VPRGVTASSQAPKPDISFRPPTLDDAHGIAALIWERDEADFADDRPAFTGDELCDWWALRPERLETDAWLARSDEGIVAYARLSREGDVAKVEDESCVHPRFRGLGIGSELVDWAESWARAAGLPRLQIRVVTDDGRRLLEARGFELVRFIWRMDIDLTSEPPPPDTPSGIEIRAYRPGTDDIALHAMHQEAFAGHWEFVPEPLDEWLSWRTERSDYDPALWQLAWNGDEIAGAVLCFGPSGLGWVLDLAVGARWRKRGLGLALLRAGFRELYRHGRPRIGLEVDSENETGATRLYERAGMRVTRRYATFEKAMAS
jgi:mycothiol synthase